MSMNDTNDLAMTLLSQLPPEQKAALLEQYQAALAKPAAKVAKPVPKAPKTIAKPIVAAMSASDLVLDGVMRLMGKRRRIKDITTRQLNYGIQRKVFGGLSRKPVGWPETHGEFERVLLELKPRLALAGVKLESQLQLDKKTMEFLLERKAGAKLGETPVFDKVIGGVSCQPSQRSLLLGAMADSKPVTARALAEAVFGEDTMRNRMNVSARMSTYMREGLVERVASGAWRLVGKPAAVQADEWSYGAKKGIVRRVGALGAGTWTLAGESSTAPSSTATTSPTTVAPPHKTSRAARMKQRFVQRVAENRAPVVASEFRAFAALAWSDGREKLRTSKDFLDTATRAGAFSALLKRRNGGPAFRVMTREFLEQLDHRVAGGLCLLVHAPDPDSRGKRRSPYWQIISNQGVHGAANETP